MVVERYLVAVVPPLSGVVTAVDNYRKRFAQYTSDTIPPHFTLFPPFLSLIGETDLIESLKKAYAGKQIGQIVMNSIDFFEGRNKVVFFAPDEVSTKFLKELHITAVNCLREKTKNVFEDYIFILEKFRPHLTIAERMPDEVFVKVREEIKDQRFNFSFSVNSVYLFKKAETDKVWRVVEEIKF